MKILSIFSIPDRRRSLKSREESPDNLTRHPSSRQSSARPIINPTPELSINPTDEKSSSNSRGRRRKSSQSILSRTPLAAWWSISSGKAHRSTSPSSLNVTSLFISRSFILKVFARFIFSKSFTRILSQQKRKICHFTVEIFLFLI